MFRSWTYAIASGTFLISLVSQASEAIDKSTEALLIQSGIKPAISSYLSRQENYYLDKYKIRKEVGVILFGYHTVKYKRVTLPVGKNSLQLNTSGFNFVYRLE